ncbi:carboxyl transferase domain-containing protein [Streptoalloteichus hindustanus]|uniref:Acetyl-coenzyme A carboxylase carboxyl transferase subunits beta/alpha n=1 Tax=Streptoalloteichus hindustanus TaxID=2017 RepID=A0A1M4YAX1_STRHI|nr:carboxyl transferase domain-containing protein [Streptoalloteichus hindustanus]SHF02865.1 acetyl-CoA carboxylase carboxyl transferase subunit beta [Streptoalloteichus hindustanus]
MDARRALDVIRVVASRFTEFPHCDAGPADPLGWPGYRERQDRLRAETGESESVRCGEAEVGGYECVLVAFDFGYFGGSIGSLAGQRIVDAFEVAIRRRLPVVSLVASGGSRMQEGMRSLVQMQRIAHAATRLRAAGLPHITVLRHPTSGGAWASVSASADVVLALPDATVAFAGARVRGGGREEADFFASKGKFEYGQVDRIVPVDRLGADLGTALGLLPPRTAPEPAPPDVPRALGRRELPATGADAVRNARDPARPRASAYLDDYFDLRYALSGDRAGGADAGMLCGIGRRQGKSVVYVAQSGAANTPAGFRTAARVIRLADRLRLPVLTLVDTPGAANDAGAERAAVGPAIAEVFVAVAEARVPVTTLVIGEGGSGGALALASRDTVWITPDGYFSVIAPEAATAILKREPEDVARTADQLRLRPQDLLALGIVHGIAGQHPTPVRPAAER